MQLITRIFMICGIVVATAAQTKGQALIAILFGNKMKNDNVKMGVYLGLSNSWITEAKGQRVRTGLAIGAYTAYKFHPKMELCMYLVMKSPKGAMGLYYSNSLVVPADSSMIGADIDRRLTYLNLCPVYRFYISPSFGVGLGPQLAIRMKARDIYHRSNEQGAMRYEINTKDYIGLFDGGLTFDVQYTLMKGKGMRLSLQANIGLFNSYEESLAYKSRQNQVVAGLGIPIGKQ